MKPPDWDSLCQQPDLAREIGELLKADDSCGDFLSSPNQIASVVRHK